MTETESGERERTGNLILDALPADEFERLRGGMDTYELEPTETLFAPDRETAWAYFPTSGVISFLRGFSDGTQIEVGVVGKEGMAGVHGFLGIGLEPTRAVVQCPGFSRRVDAGLLRKEFERGEVLHKLLLRFTYILLKQVSLTAACNQLHGVDQRLARWLLAMSDRVSSMEIPLSHEFLAHMLGTGRARITEAIGRFRERGGVDSFRGRIVIQNRTVLEEAACECYEEISTSYATVVDSRYIMRKGPMEIAAGPADE